MKRAMPGSMKTAKNQIQVIGRAAAILRVLEHQSMGLSLGEIAKRVNLARSTVQRIVGALQAERLVIPASPNGRVRLGPTLHRLAASIQSDVVALAHSQVEELSKKLRETVDFSMVRNDHIVFLDQVMGAQRLRAVSAVGEAFPLHCCANGKAALALLDDAAILELIGEEYERRTGRTLWSWNTLRRDLETTRRRGYALDREEHTLGISAVGVALRDLFGNIVAVSVPVPTQRFLGNEKNIAKALLRVKRELASSISRDEEAESLTQHRRARANARV